MCEKCGGKGHYGVMVWSGAYMLKPCDCDISKQKNEKAMERLQKLHREILQKLECAKA